jgi:Holliday junction resolvase RusA-like endonuclease
MEASGMIELQQGGAYSDDNQIVRSAIEKGQPFEEGMTLVQIRKASE